MSLIDRTVSHPLGDNPPQSRLLYGQDVRESLRLLPDASVQMVATSPPYWGLRDYGGEHSVWGGHPGCTHLWGAVEGYTGHRGNRGQVPQTKWKKNQTYPQQADKNKAPQTTCQICGAWRGQLGMEPTPALFVAHLVEVFEEVRRVLRPDGVIFVNLGDSYAGGGRAGKNPEYQAKHTMFGKPAQHKETFGVPMAAPEGLKAKDLVGIPWRVALGLQDAGWYLRSDIIWEKSACMPESVRDRCTRSHEYIFMLAHPDSKGRYSYDQEAIKEETSGLWNTHKKINPKLEAVRHGTAQSGGTAPRLDVDRRTRNKRTVWTVNPKPYPGAHFACWPEALVEPMILAGTSAYGCCSKCLAPWTRVIEKGDLVSSDGSCSTMDQATRIRKSRGWEPTCKCDAPVQPCTVLDIFSGSATTGAVAMRLGRDYIGTDLQPDYLDLAVARLEDRAAPKAPQPDEEGEDLIIDLFGCAL